VETGEVFDKPDSFDAAAQLQHAMATLPRPLPVRVLLHTDLAGAQREVGRYIGPLLEVDGGVRLATSTTSYTWFARMLASLNFDFTIEGPDELREAVREEARRLARLADLSC